MNHRLSVLTAALVFAGFPVLGACSSSKAPVPQRQGGAGGGGGGGGGGGVDDTGLTGGVDDTGEDDTGGQGADDTGVIAEPSGQVCYLGPERDYSVCIDVVAYDPGWGGDYAYPEPYDGDPQYAAPARYVDLDAVSSELEVAPNFVLSELMQAYKGRFGVFQGPALDRLQQLRDASGGPLTVNSGYRNVTYNAGVGGVTYSRHQYGDAADLDPSAVSLDELGELCTSLDASYVGMYTTHVHCDWRYTSLDEAFYDTSSSLVEPALASLPVHEARIEWAADGLLRAPATGFDEGEPLRRWFAYDNAGRLLSQAESETFEAPEHAARVTVEVGGPTGVQAHYLR